MEIDRVSTKTQRLTRRFLWLTRTSLGHFGSLQTDFSPTSHSYIFDSAAQTNLTILG